MSHLLLGGILFILGFGLMGWGLKNQAFFADPQGWVKNRLSEPANKLQFSGLFRTGVVIWTAGTLLLVLGLTQRDAEKLKQCQKACQKIGYNRAKWVTFCRCLEGSKSLDLTDLKQNGE